MSLSAQEFRRAWRVVLASAFGAGTGAVPLAFYSFGAFIEPLTKAFDWTRTEISAAPLFLQIGGMFAGVVAGAMADRFGARRVVLWSQLLLIAAFAGLSLIGDSLTQFYIGYALVAVLGAGTMTMTWSRAITGWFVEGRGLALGVSLVGTGTVGAILPAYIGWLTAEFGWRVAYLGLSALPLVFGLPLTFLFFRDPPEDDHQRAECALPDTLAGSYRFGEALRTWCFWQMVASFSVVALAIASVLVHCVPMLTDRGIAPATAAWLAGLIGIAVTFGRLASGYLLDRMRGPTVAFAMFGLPSLACLLLTVSGNSLWLCGVAIVLVGLAGGAEHDIAAYFTAKYFGRRNFGKIYGLLYTLYGVCTGIGPLIAGRSVDATGSYIPALHAGAGLFAVSAVMILFLSAPRNRAQVAVSQVL